MATYSETILPVKPNINGLVIDFAKTLYNGKYRIEVYINNSTFNLGDIITLGYDFTVLAGISESLQVSPSMVSSGKIIRKINNTTNYKYLLDTEWPACLSGATALNNSIRYNHYKQGSTGYNNNAVIKNVNQTTTRGQKVDYSIKHMRTVGAKTVDRTTGQVTSCKKLKDLGNLTDNSGKTYYNLGINTKNN